MRWAGAAQRNGRAYDAFGVFGTALQENVCVFHSSSSKNGAENFERIAGTIQDEFCMTQIDECDGAIWDETKKPSKLYMDKVPWPRRWG